MSDMTSPPYPDVEVVDEPAGAKEAQDEERETVTQPQKLIRIASMVRNMLEEVRRAPSTTPGGRC